MKPKKRSKKEQKRFEEARAKILQKQKSNPDPLFREWSVDSMVNLKIALSGGPSPENRNIEREDFAAALRMVEEAINALYDSQDEDNIDLRKDWSKTVKKFQKKYSIGSIWD